MVTSSECISNLGVWIKSSCLPLPLPLFSFCVIGLPHVLYDECDTFTMKSAEDHAYAPLRGAEELLEELIPRTGAGVRSKPWWLKNAFYLALVISQGLVLISLGFLVGTQHHGHCSQREERRQYSEIAWGKTDLSVIV